MIKFQKKNNLYKLYTWLPIVILFISVLNEFDFNYLNIQYFTFNFTFVLIFYFSLKDYSKFDYFIGNLKILKNLTLKVIKNIYIIIILVKSNLIRNTFDTRITNFVTIWPVFLLFTDYIYCLVIFFFIFQGFYIIL